MRDYAKEFADRVSYIRELVEKSGVSGIVYGNSGGKDCSLVGILCKFACENTVGIMMPCASKRNFEQDMKDAKEVSEHFGIQSRVIDLTDVRQCEMDRLSAITTLTPAAVNNIAPRLRMTTLYAVAASENRLVAGTGNRSEAYMGYFTKWGDGACDFNPISDLTATEVIEFLKWLTAPACVINKAPSAGLFDGQTDEDEMGVTYNAIDTYILTGEASERDKKVIDRFHRVSEHKRSGISVFKKV
ncbi:MAG: NAD(+) synthase [Clostridiales bacterium]|nr:NAD(+) synthase [Clostridiales bacterium]MDY2909468.1 NAD(+) synthase [Oscillospiraceae bacterium]